MHEWEFQPALLTEYMLERLLKSTWPALTLFLTPLMVPFLLQILMRLLLKSISLLALAYKSRSSGSHPFSSRAGPATRPFRWLLASLVASEPPCPASGLLVQSESAESEAERHRDFSSLNTSVKTRPLLADATLNRTVLPTLSFSCFNFGPSIGNTRKDALHVLYFHSAKPDVLFQSKP